MHARASVAASNCLDGQTTTTSTSSPAQRCRSKNLIPCGRQRPPGFLLTSTLETFVDHILLTHLLLHHGIRTESLQAHWYALLARTARQKTLMPTVPVAIGAALIDASIYDVPGGYRAVMFDRFTGVKPQVSAK